MSSAPASIGATMLALRMQAENEAPPQPAPAPAGRRSRATVAGTAESAPSVRPLPAYVVHALARFRLLHDIPLAYLVPDMRLLPLESVRFFTLDAQWLDALAEGALLAAGGGSRERQRALNAAATASAAADGAIGLVRDVSRGRLVVDAAAVGESAAKAAAPMVSGMLLHSALVTGWTALKLCAWHSAAVADVPLGVDAGELARTRPELVVPLLRIERVSPSLLLVLFDGVPRLVWIEEPHHAVQFGLEQAGARYRLDLRDVEGRPTGGTVTVPMRSGAAAGVVDVAALALAVDQALPLGTPRGSAALALQLLQAPSRQRFHN
jgi:hypothetical protein